jgi:glycerol-3-phosphate O-acyltransferase
LIDLIAGGIHWLYSQGYGSIRYDRRRLTEISALGQEYPLVFLPSHRSNLDRLSLQFILWENDLPPNHTAGAINMNFFPVGALVRRTGVFFIRRSFKDNPLYKFVLRTYIDHLIENRFSLEWYLEGGRSRSGRLLPPRFGLLAYVVESLKRGKAEDVMLIPVSIAYDQIQDLSTYTHEVKGGKKEQETFSWFLSAVRSLRRRYGNIHIRFGEPVSVASELKHIDTAEEGSRDLAKLAFEIMYRISRITPITPASVVCIALLQGDEEAPTLAELADFCGQLDTFITDHEFPTTEPLALEEPVAVAKVLKLLTGQGIVSSDSNPLRVFWLDAEQRLAASYYRNVVVHFFVPRGIAELAILAAGDAKDPPAAFWAEVSRLRGLLESEFYFADKARFRNEMELDLASVATDWEGRLARPGQLIDQMRPRVADWAVRPFLKG